MREIRNICALGKCLLFTSAIRGTLTSGRRGRNRFPSVRAFLHLADVAFRFLVIMPIAGLRRSDGLSRVLFLNIRQWRSGLEKIRGGIGEELGEDTGEGYRRVESRNSRVDK